MADAGKQRIARLDITEASPESLRVSGEAASRPRAANAQRPQTSRKRKRRSRKTVTDATGASLKAGGQVWSVVNLCGGRYRSRAVFSVDERCLLVATDSTLKVVSVQNGQTIRSIRSRFQTENIVDVIIDPSNEFRVLVAYANARIEVYDWTDGLFITAYKSPEKPLKLVSAGGHGFFLLTASNLFICIPAASKSVTPSTDPQLHTNKILEWKSSSNYQPYIAADISSNTFCVAVGSDLWVGRDFIASNPSSIDALQIQQYFVPQPVTALACFQNMLAVGEASGHVCIYFHTDNQDHLRESSIISWHNSPISALRFASKGAYLLSCASEDVLVIAQISTGQKQFVPRLGSAIIGLTPSPSGASYAISLGNNTIKLIDAANSQLISEIPGPILPPRQPSTVALDRCPKAIALLQPSSDRLYITGVEGTNGTVQGYDLLHNQQVVRFDVAPLSRIQTSGVEKRPVRQVETKLAAFSHDGGWLATLDEWHDRGSIEDSGVAETNLKFWQLRGREWVMTTKVESPHGVLCRVIGLASPKFRAALEFATLGDDSSIKVWRSFPESNGDSSPNWALYRTIGSQLASNLSQGSVVYSSDGTLLFANIGISVFVISQASGEVLKCLDIGPSVSSVDVLDRYVLCLQNQPSVLSSLDIVTGSVLFSERFASTVSTTLAVNNTVSRFAVCLSFPESKSTIFISRILHGVRVVESQIHLKTQVPVLLCANLSLFSGFLYFDELGQIGGIGTRTTTPRTISAEMDSAASLSLVRFERPRQLSQHVMAIPAKEILGVLEGDGEINLTRTLEEIVQCI